MYDLYLFNNMYAECDIAAFDEAYIEVLKDLLDDKVSVRLLEFFEKFDASPASTDTNEFALLLQEKVDLMKEILMPSLIEKTFHFKVQDKNLIEQISILTVESLSAVVTEKEEADLLGNIQWLLDNRHNWISEIRPRNRESFVRLIELSAIIEGESYYLKGLYEMHMPGVELQSHRDLRKRLKSNKVFFCANNEAVRRTRMGRIIANRKEVEMVHHALIYRKKCRELNINRISRRLPIKG